MGESYIVRRGGGTGKLFAVIAATYPAGSTCTCTNGTKTFKAPDTSGKALFNVPALGTWTVSCADGSNTASKNVSITVAGQIENVTLGYGGNVISAIGSFKEVRKNGTGGITVTLAGETIATSTGIDSNAQGEVCYFGDVLFDLSKYNTLKFKLNLSGIGACYIGFYSNNTSPNGWDNAVTTKSWGTTEEANGEFSVDLANVSTAAYFGIALTGFKEWEGGTKTAVLTDVNLEV